MQTLARVNRTFRGKGGGLLVGYAPLADNLQKALAGYSPRDQETRPMAATSPRPRNCSLTSSTRSAPRSPGSSGGPSSSPARSDRSTRSRWRRPTHSRNPTTPGNKVDNGSDDDAETLADRFRRLTRQLTAAWADRLHRLAFAVQQQPTQIHLALGPLIRPGQPAEHLGREPHQPRPNLGSSPPASRPGQDHTTRRISGSDTPNKVLLGLCGHHEHRTWPHQRSARRLVPGM
jgi:hypothetical protein